MLQEISTIWTLWSKVQELVELKRYSEQNKLCFSQAKRIRNLTYGGFVTFPCMFVHNF